MNQPQPGFALAGACSIFRNMEVVQNGVSIRLVFLPERAYEAQLEIYAASADAEGNLSTYTVWTFGRDLIAMATALLPGTQVGEGDVRFSSPADSSLGDDLVLTLTNGFSCDLHLSRQLVVDFVAGMYARVPVGSEPPVFSDEDYIALLQG